MNETPFMTQASPQTTPTSSLGSTVNNVLENLQDTAATVLGQFGLGVPTSNLKRGQAWERDYTCKSGDLTFQLHLRRDKDGRLEGHYRVQQGNGQAGERWPLTGELHRDDTFTLAGTQNRAHFRGSLKGGIPKVQEFTNGEKFKRQDLLFTWNKPATPMATPGQTYPGQIRSLSVPPGQVTLALLPQVSTDDLIALDDVVIDPLSPLSGRIAPERLTLSAELRAAVQDELDPRRPVGTTLDLRAPQYVWVSVTATIRAYSGAARPVREDVRRRALRALYAYLNPFTGGPDGTGWPFGRALSVSELYGLLRGVPGVEVAEDVQIVLTEPGQPDQREHIVGSLPLPPQAIIVSDVHHVRVDH